MRKCRFCQEDIDDAAVVCPHCGKGLIPGRVTPPSEASTMVTEESTPGTKKCPHCAEEVQAAAVVCKHCNRNIPAATPRTSGAKVTLIGCLAIVGLIVVAFVVLIVIGSTLPSSPSSSSTATPHMVEYRVSGTAHLASLTYENASGGTEQKHDAVLPWTYQLGEPHRGQFLYISAQNSGSYGTIVTEIVIDGQVVKHSESEGEYSIASASGRY
jgi:hypothetical protein